MKVITIESEAFKHLSSKIDRIDEAIKRNRLPDIDERKLLSSTETCEYLHISRRTLARLTSSGF